MIRGKMMHTGPRAALLACLAVAPCLANAAELDIPVLVPVTGFLAVEGASQRDGAVLALRKPPAGITIKSSVIDTGTSPEVAVNALERALSDGTVAAAVAPMLGTQMLALLPVAEENKVPLITISGTAAITQKHNPYIFRFFPGDDVAKAAQVRYAIDHFKIAHPAILYQTTAYGQSGHAEILARLKEASITPVYEDALDVTVKDLAPSLAKARAAGADSLLLQLHGGPTALLMKAVAASGWKVPIIAGSGLTQPATTALLEPAELAGACAETSASPESQETPAMAAFVAAYRAAFNATPDGFALAQYDATNMVLAAAAQGAHTAAEITKALATMQYDGLAMRYHSDGTGNMAHSAVIVCYDGASRVPRVAWHFDKTP